MYRRSVLTVFGVVLLAACAADAPPPSVIHIDPVSFCSRAGGTYLGDRKCQLSDGTIAQPYLEMVRPEIEMSAVPVPQNSPQAWALATTAILFEANRDRHDLLGGDVVVPAKTERARKLLSEWWSVKNRDQLLAALKWLQFQGHRADFDELGRKVDAMNEQQYMAAEAALAADSDQLNSLHIVRQNHQTLGRPGILAWDLVRYIAVCRWGYMAGYLSEREAWEYIMPAARRLQETFSSWQDLQKDYLIGREFWSAEPTDVNGGRFRIIFHLLLQDPNSPWNVNPWTMNLGVSTPLPLTAQ